MLNGGQTLTGVQKGVCEFWGTPTLHGWAVQEAYVAKGGLLVSSYEEMSATYGRSPLGAGNEVSGGNDTWWDPEWNIWNLVHSDGVGRGKARPVDDANVMPLGILDVDEVSTLSQYSLSHCHVSGCHVVRRNLGAPAHNSV